MDDSIAEIVLKEAKKAGANYAEARLEESQSSGFILKNGVPHISGFDISTGLALRIKVNDTFSFASTNILEKQIIIDLVKKTVKSAALSAGSGTGFSEEKPSKAFCKVSQKVDFRDISPSKKIRILKDIDSAIIGTKFKISGRYFMLSDVHTKKVFVNSEGSRIESEIPRTDFMHIFSLQHSGQLMQRYWQYGFSGGFETITGLGLPEKLRQETIALGKTLENGVKTPKGKIDMVIGPEIVGIVVHESAGHPGEADRILGREAAQAGESFLKPDSLGQKIGSDKVTIIDDPSIKGSFGFYEYDDEGVKAQKRYLYKNGVISDFLHNRESATQMGVKSNASARASNYDREPIVRMANTYMEPGDFSDEELFEGIKKGVYMKSFMEWNIDDKRYNQKYVGAEAYLIENGKITVPVKYPILEMTTTALYSAVDAVGKKVEFHAGTCGKGEPMQGIPVWFGGPPLRLKNVKLG